MTTSALGLVLALVTGVAVGAAFFGGLWWTTRLVPQARRPALLVLVSYLVRLGVTIGAFILIAGESWERWIGVTVGFVIGRAIVGRALVDRAPGAPASVRGTPEGV